MISLLWYIKSFIILDLKLFVFLSSLFPLEFKLIVPFLKLLKEPYQNYNMVKHIDTCHYF